MADDDFKKLIDVSPAAEPVKKPERSFFPSVKWGLVFIIVIGGVAFFFNAYFTHKYEMPLAAKVVEKEVKPADYEFRVQEQLKQKDAENPKPTEVKPQDAVPHEDVTKLNERIDKLDKKTDALAAYIAARDLQASVESPADFKENLGLLRKYFAAIPDVAGKLDILDQAVASGVVTREKLLSDLKIVEKNIESNSGTGVTESISNALGQLVKVTKVRGEVDGADYESIIRRAEIRLSAESLDGDQLQQTINEMNRLGKPAENFVTEASNLKRVMDVADDITEYAKSKLAE